MVVGQLEGLLAGWLSPAAPANIAAVFAPRSPSPLLFFSLVGARKADLVGEVKYVHKLSHEPCAKSPTDLYSVSYGIRPSRS